ncbi:MAG: hypothetical protein AUI15_29855 [Actinobacteria bacterium 13_2_20CM_2_66_6]|nr:MAG: hypothetical protein AUI15_29855 [Actinobacteria bacterium 13_2_20CM_2_66_6]
MSAWSTWDTRTRKFAAAAAVVLVASIAYAFILKTGLFGDRTVTIIDDLGEAAAAAIASGACAWAATRAGGKERLGWTLMSISTGLWAAGELVWSYYEVWQQVTVPYPSLADAGFLGAVPFAIGGIRAFWSDAARGYPVTDIVVGTVLILAIRRATHQQAGKMAFLLAGIACYSVADSAFAYLSAHGTYDSVGSVLNTGWFAGFLLIALAATYPAEPARATLKPARLDLWQLALPWMTLLLASAGDVYSSLTGHDIDLFMSSLTAALALLLTVNMIIERKEFLEMLNEIEESHSTLNRDFRTGLVGIEQFSRQMADSEQLDVAEARRLAGEINRNAERLDRLVEQML